MRKHLVVALVVVGSLALPALAATPPFGGIQVLSPRSHQIFQPVVAMDDSGNASAFWNYASTSHIGMKVADRVVGEGFAPAYTLPSPGSNQVADPAIAMSPNGTTAVVWIDQIGDNVVLLGNYREPGGDWGTRQVISNPMNDQDSFSSPHVAVSDSGRVVVTYWHYLEDQSHNIEAVLSDASGTFGTPQVLDNRMGTESVGNFGPNAGVDAVGNAMILWERFDDAATDPRTFVTYALAGATGTTFGSPVQLAETDQDGIDPRLAVNPSGVAVAIWIQAFPTDSDSYMNSARGTAATGLTALGTVPGSRPDWIDLALDEDGNAIAARRGVTFGPTQERIDASVLTTGATAWGAAQVLDTNADTDGSLETSDETLDVAAADGGGIVAWAREDPFDYMPARIAVLDPTTHLFEAKVAITSLAAQVDRLRVDMNPAGDVVLVWRDDYRVYSLGTWAAPANGTLTVDVSPRKQLLVSGSLSPDDPGAKVAVTLYRKRTGSFRKITTKNATLNSSSDYNVSFSAPNPGTCKVKAVFAGDGLVQADSATKTFTC
ncbi:MAG: hypothetical protein QOG04_861 [Actinomycetota bacterium]|jgi:hypothetical protein|nr:hypothetical protein [Actinomycetota bacterium]